MGVGEFLFLLTVYCLTTCIIEMLVTLCFHDRKKWIKAGIICNVITNPILNMLLPFADNVIYKISRRLRSRGMYLRTNLVSFIVVLVLEIGVIVLETWMYGFFTKEPLRRRAKVAVFTNVISYLLGFVTSIFVYDLGYFFFR